MEYVYEGTSRVKCSKCGFEHEVFFTGDDNFHPEEAITSSLIEDGWEVADMICPECNTDDYMAEQREKDQMIDADYFDDYDDYDLYDEEED